MALNALNRRSAVGDRQMLPVHTNRTCRAYSLHLAAFDVFRNLQDIYHLQWTPGHSTRQLSMDYRGR